MAHFKYPSTPHLPGSGSRTADDIAANERTLENLRSGRELVVTEKMDGGNISLYRDDFHARSLDAKAQLWDTRAKALWAGIRYSIPEGIRISGESVHARRSVAYENLPGPVMVFGVWRYETLLSWDETVEIAAGLGLPMVPVLYRGDDLDSALSAWSNSGRTEDDSEGFVVRETGAFDRNEFAQHIAKWVRRDHVRTDADWRHRTDFDLNTFA